jgi:hypothetical protein
MTVKPLAEVFERLKELRRQGGSDSDIRSTLGQELRLYPDFPGDELDEKDDLAADFSHLVRKLEIKALAGRIFGDDGKANAWLHRPNSALSGQKPAALLKDELGAAVVREMLERVDHGIFA